MKKHLLLFTLLSASCAFAGFTVPKSVHGASEITKASEEAVKAKKPVAIMVSDKDTTCPICSGASATAISSLKSKTVMVYVKAGETSELPQAAKAALSTTSGKYMPQVVILNSDMSETIAAFAYNDDASFKKAIREAEKKMKPAKEGTKSAG